MLGNSLVMRSARGHHAPSMSRPSSRATATRTGVARRRCATGYVTAGVVIGTRCTGRSRRRSGVRENAMHGRFLHGWHHLPSGCGANGGITLPMDAGHDSRCTTADNETARLRRYTTSGLDRPFARILSTKPRLSGACRSPKPAAKRLRASSFFGVPAHHVVLSERARVLQALGIAAEKCPLPRCGLRSTDELYRAAPIAGIDRSDDVTDLDLRRMNLWCIPPVLYAHVFIHPHLCCHQRTRDSHHQPTNAATTLPM